MPNICSGSTVGGCLSVFDMGCFCDACSSTALVRYQWMVSSVDATRMDGVS